VFGSAAMVVDPSMKRQPCTLADAEQIVCAAVTAFGRGAKSMRVAPPAVESVRRKFIPSISSALESPDWQADWRREQVYLRAYAEALGQRARTLAAEDRRTIILPADIDAATTKMRGYMPIAGRWCPV
jgi:hypothetical protein